MPDPLDLHLNNSGRLRGARGRRISEREVVPGNSWAVLVPHTCSVITLLVLLLIKPNHQHVDKSRTSVAKLFERSLTSQQSGGGGALPPPVITGPAACSIRISML